jgi:acetyl/propionyl-CoA carboxylase alpha subunit
VGKVFTADPGTDDERRVRVEKIQDRPGRFAVTLDLGTERERTVEVDAQRLPSGGYHILWGDRSIDIDLGETDDKWTLAFDGHTREILLLDERKLAMRATSGGTSGEDGPDLFTPMAGKIVGYLVSVGDSVEEGQGVVIVEAMKMENELKAHKSGVVTSLGAAVGEAVEVGTALLGIEDAQ